MNPSGPSSFFPPFESPTAKDRDFYSCLLSSSLYTIHLISNFFLRTMSTQQAEVTTLGHVLHANQVDSD